MKFFFWKIYTWLYNLLCMFLEILPMFIRDIVFRMILGKCGKIDLIDYKAYFRYPSKICIGKNVSVNRGCFFLASAHSDEKYDIVIGDRCVFAPNVKLLAAGHDYCFLDLPDTFGQIRIGDDVWIGADSVVLQGVAIGEGAVVGAGSVVTKDVSPWMVVAGNPARPIRERRIAQTDPKGPASDGVDSFHETNG